MVSCPECQSSKVWKDGLRYVQGNPIQRYICRDCGFRFSDPEFSKKNCLSEIQQTGFRQICVLDKKAKNLVAEQKNPILQENNKTKSNLVNYALHLKKDGKSDATIETYTKLLRTLDNQGDLYDPESVKSVIAFHYKSKVTKRLAVCAYSSYLNFVGGQWKKPKYRPEHKQVFIPTEEELQLAINSGTKESVIYSVFLYETGARDNEAQRLEWTDLDRERMNVTVKASKNGDSRIVPISENLLNLLFSLPKDKETVFSKSVKRTAAFHNRMVTLAKKYDNPRFKKIHLHTFRHVRALKEYHKTRDILHVMGILGHRNINTTYRYIRLYNQIYKHQQRVKFITKVASTKEERCELINDDWMFVEKDRDDWYFKKPE